MALSAHRYQKQVKLCKETLGDMSWAGEITPADNPNYPNRAINYARISQLLFKRFRSTHLTPANPLMSASVAGHGFAAIGNSVGRCDEAYARYCALNQQTAKGTELVEALRKPQTTRLLTFLASMRDFKNDHYEAALGLRSGRLRGAEFIYHATDDPHFEPNAKLFGDAKVAATKQAEKDGTPTGLTDNAPDICPARIFIPQLVEVVISGCEQAGLFDFAIEPPTE